MKHSNRYTAVFATLVCLFTFVSRGGPRTSVQEFFARHVNTSIPELRQIPDRMVAGDVVGAEKIFAEYVRSTLHTDQLNHDWLTRS